MAAIQVHMNHHYLFACEVINELNIFYQIPVKLHQVQEQFFNNDIRWALLTISYLFRKDYHKIFRRLKEQLDSQENFVEYCTLIPAKRNDRYFFNFLKRVSTIYEMTVYCFKKGNDFFLAARDCIADYVDIRYFYSVGSWPRLNEVAVFLRNLGEPLTLVILEESTLRQPLDFSKTVERIVNRLKRRNDSELLNSPATRRLVEQQEKFNARETGSNSSKVKKKIILRPGSNSSEVSAGIVSIEVEKKAIIDYLQRLRSPKDSDELSRGRNKHTPGGTQYESSNVSKSPQPFELEKPCTDTESTVSRECDELATESTSSLSKKLAETLNFLSDPIVHERLEEDEGKHGSLRKLSDKSNDDDDVNKTSNSKQLEEDLFLSESSNDENSQQCKNSAKDIPHSTNNESLYLSDESIIAESPSSRKKFNSPDDKTSNSELFEDDLIASEDESAQKPFMKESLQLKKGLLDEYDSNRESDSSESQSPTKYANTSDNAEARLNLIMDGFLNRAMQIRPDIFPPEIVTEQQSTSKKDKHDDNNSPMVKSHDSRFVLRTIEKVAIAYRQSRRDMLRVELKAAIAAFAASVSRNENSQAASGTSTKPDGETETAMDSKESDDGQSTNVKDSQPQQRKKRKGKKKKKKGKGK